MRIYQEGAGQIDDNFRRKNIGIAQLGIPDTFIRQAALRDFGLAMSSDDRLTLHMESQLISQLNLSGLLTYKQQDVNQTSIPSENTDDQISQDFDLARWEVERNGTVQAHVIKAAALLSIDDITVSHQVLRIADLLAKMRTVPKTFKTPFTVEPYAASLTRLAAVEEEIYYQRLEQVDVLVRNKLAPERMRMYVVARDLEGYKALSKEDSIYNRIVALHFVEQSKAQDIEGRFKELQAVVHYGYTKDIRDARDFYTLYDGK